jgi:RimJ/RimL family protein N-acetyltransferase
MILGTEHLIVRELTKADAPALAAIHGDIEVMQYLASGRTRTLEETEAEIEHHRGCYERDGHGLWAVVLRATDELIGRCGLLHWRIEDAEEIEVAYLLGRAHWGRGLGTEAARAVRDWAFAHVPTNRLVSLAYPHTKASARVAEKLGMRFEKEVELFGRPVHVYAMARGPLGAT